MCLIRKPDKKRSNIEMSNLSECITSSNLTITVTV